jgi:hypothetical protein
MPMPSKAASKPQVIFELAMKLTNLPEEDLELVIELVACLEEKHPPEKAVRPASVEEIREESRRRARLLRDVPREQLVARFMEVGEQIRQEAIAKGTATEGDWTGD